MALLPGGDQPLLTGYLFGKQLSQESRLIDLEHENNMIEIELGAEIAKWKNYAHSLEEALNNMGANATGIAATRKALVDEGQSCPHPEHHKLSHNKELRNQIYNKGAQAAELIIEKPRR